MRPTATYDSETQTFTLRVGLWWNAYPIDELPKWLEFYRGQRERFPKSVGTYDGTIAALDQLAKELGVVRG